MENGIFVAAAAVAGAGAVAAGFADTSSQAAAAAARSFLDIQSPSSVAGAEAGGALERRELTPFQASQARRCGDPRGRRWPRTHTMRGQSAEGLAPRSELALGHNPWLRVN